MDGIVGFCYQLAIWVQMYGLVYEQVLEPGTAEIEVRRNKIEQKTIMNYRRKKSLMKILIRFQMSFAKSHTQRGCANWSSDCLDQIWMLPFLGDHLKIKTRKCGKRRKATD